MQRFTIYDNLTSRQARNLLESSLSETVRPWFSDLEDARVSAAIDALANPRKRGKAARFLGLTLVAKA